MEPLPDTPTSPTDPPVVDTQQLSKRFGDFWAVRTLDLAIRRGEVYGLLGPNGAGKTTTLRMLAGLMTPTSGTLKVMGRAPHEHPLEVKQKLGFLTGDTGLYQRLTPLELLRFFGKLQGMDKARLTARVEAMVEALGLTEFAKKPCGALSTGQKQRVNIARAMLHEPLFLILDEPTSGLDIISAHFILDAIRDCRAQGRAVLFSTHILAETELLCDRIGILHRGQKLIEGSPQALLEATNAPHLAGAFMTLIQEADRAATEDETARRGDDVA